MLKARYFLERHVYQVNDGCPLAMLAHALVLANSELARLAMQRLANVSTNEEGDFGWPRPPENTDWLYEEGVSQASKPALTSQYKHLQYIYIFIVYVSCIYISY